MTSVGAGERIRTVRFAKALALSYGTVKLTCPTPNFMLRKALAKEFFFQRKKSPGFNYFSHDERWKHLLWQETHFVHGDGDAEYL